MDIFELFHPHATQEAQRLLADESPRLVHYTSAATVAKILTSSEMWFRTPETMNDTSEYRWGMDRVDQALGGDSGASLRKALDEIQPRLLDGIWEEIKEHWVYFYQCTFISCYSEHDTSEDDFGRLSMWRAYGQGSGVAVVMHARYFLTDEDEFRVYTTPVIYGDIQEVERVMASVAQNLTKHRQMLIGLPHDELRHHVSFMLLAGVVALKHRGFHEEREWRVFGQRGDVNQDLCPIETEVIGGVPQRVLKLKIRPIPNTKLEDFCLANLIERIIIGPSPFAWVTRDALIDLAEKAGIGDAHKKVVVSGVPLRT